MTKNVFLNCTYFAGGDDVQQLCEAGEAEFLEIMDLVGMASKPMHVRRLQKALQEWVHNPGEFLKHMPKVNFYGQFQSKSNVYITISENDFDYQNFLIAKYKYFSSLLW